MNRLDGRVAIVTGAARGIGLAIVEALIEAGARVAAWDVEPMTSLPRGAEADLVDVTDAAAVEDAVSSVVRRLGAVDVLINNAGVLRDAQLVKWTDGAVAGRMSDEDFDRVLDVNVRGAFICTRAVAPHMIRQRRGVILSASSVVARDGNFGQTNYAASKQAVEGMTASWARELGRYGIRVNAVAPGFIDTAMARKVPPDRLDAVVAHTPLGRLGTPQEVAWVYAWLASDAAAFVHGAVIPVDGGLVIGT